MAAQQRGQRMRAIWNWVGIAGAVLAAYIAKTVFHFSETQIGVAFLVAVIAIFLWVLEYQVNALKEKRPKFEKKRLDALFRSKPIEVKHKPPKNLTTDGQERFGAEAYDFEFFREFWFFGEAANRSFKDGPWRLQEIDETEISGMGLAGYGPAYGRRYEIFFNQVKMGLLQIIASHHRDFEKQDKSVIAEIELDAFPVTALPYSHIRGFLSGLAGLLTKIKRPDDGGKSEYEQATSNIENALSEAMWDVVSDYTLSEQHSFWGDFTVRIDGTPEQYYHMEGCETAERMRAAQGEQATARSA